MDPSVLTVDCVGLQCPAPIQVLTRAAKKAPRPALLEVHADDGDFAIDVRAWCRTTGAVLKSLLEVDGRFVAQIALEGERTATDRPADERAHVPPTRVQPVRIDVDCRNVRGPPVLHLDRVARAATGPALLVVRSDDHRFPTDLEPWCRGTGAELIHLDGGDGSYVATIGWGGARLPTAPAPEPRVATPDRRAPPAERALSRTVALLVVRDDRASASSALTVAVASAQNGMDVQVFFAHSGVNVLRRYPLAPASWWTRWFAGAATPTDAPTTAQLERAAELGVRFVVCEASLAEEGLVAGDLIALPTLEVGTLGAFATDAKGAALSLVF